MMCKTYGLTEGMPDTNRDISVGFEVGTSKGASDLFNFGEFVGAEEVCLSESWLGCDDSWSYCEEGNQNHTYIPVNHLTTCQFENIFTSGENNATITFDVRDGE